ncbi:glutamate--tRNA ligase [Candidatus Nomurabacteria bacterium RIFCSPHIGHO2_12_FULL_37_29]|uniref:Glutamate--tRNA ligase n=1 Tax=Candidatus Nomurabacteria bacterium RIFCSPHIGHO2_12_FULL_37_29 TaxID=1801759 RepID=A0A1F6WBJ5_9BACT|nr:MAG: glutamate--tRNA ligase [Candidatus Nomurabacteria bacterium RIFCSPHIGHO2_01_FULL_37_110]OGI79278.1 MAG: glutamate--tRNA ligase [Candidatus Nomurabacteria bacterium RIFCSPHIGHO2_12_FULL_37_29]OGI85510.1 MAG: glutamate--tRNA ligase [Candidatus Nomurabacteria bacterium RIFCSPLOWO2_01_FULL_37_49]
MSNKIQYNKVVTRFAPSPTGFMHIGGVRTALFAWLWARKNNGTFILRIEDTDKKREVEGSIDHIMASLKWLGIDWDEGVDIGGEHAPYKQSKRLYTYKKYANILVEKGLAYADPYSEEEVANFRKSAEENKKPFLYRKHRPENPPLWDGSKPLRLKTNVKKHKWHDLVRGDLEAGEEAVDDLVLIKSDGYPTYNFAHIIDDLLMKVTHIFRADEFISSTPNYLAIYEALEIKRPEFVTLPPILGEAGTKKLGKRDGAKDILDYQKEGYLPEAMLNFLAFIGWNPGGGDNREILSKDEIIKSFDLSHIQISGAKFNEEKLDWINKEHLKKLSRKGFVKKAKQYFNEIGINIKEILAEKNLSETEFDNYLVQFKDRITTFRDLVIFMYGYITTTDDLKNLEISKVEKINTTSILPTSYNYHAPTDYLFKSKDPNLSEVWELFIKKNIIGDLSKNKTLKEYLTETNDLLIEIKSNDWKKIEKNKNDTSLWRYAEKMGKGNILWPLRVVLSGKDKSPDPFEIMKKIGKKSSLRRIKNTLKIIDISDLKVFSTNTNNNQISDPEVFNINTNNNKTSITLH